MKNYTVCYQLHEDEEKQFKVIEAVNMGDAYKKLLKIHPEAKIQGGFIETRIMNEWWHIDYEPVSQAKVDVLPIEKRFQSEMDLGFK